jgi:hypothetical protein
MLSLPGTIDNAWLHWFRAGVTAGGIEWHGAALSPARCAEAAFMPSGTGFGLSLCKFRHILACTHNNVGTMQRMMPANLANCYCRFHVLVTCRACIADVQCTC